MRIAALAADQNSVIATRQLAELGVDGDAIAVRVRRGQLHRVHRGIYAVGTGVLTLKGKLSAAVLACGDDAVLSHYAAAAWHGMVPWERAWPDVVVPRGAGRAVRGIRSHRSSSLTPLDYWRRENILVTTPERTVLDLAAEMAPKALRRMVRQALAEGRMSIARLGKVLARAPRHRGAPALRALLADGHVPTRSELEDRALDLLRASDIELPEVNALLVLDGQRTMPDLLWRESRVVVELDGAAWHGDRLTREHDAARQARLEAHGYRVLRITWQQVVTQPRQTLARIRAALGPAARP